MATNVYNSITARGTIAQFKEQLNQITPIWPQFCETISSDAPDEEHVWMGTVPDPREYLHGRNYVNVSDFTYNIKNKTYELSAIFDQTSLEDDRHGLIPQRVAEFARIWVTYKDVLFAAALNNAQTSGYNGFDAVTYFNSSHVVGAATPDNVLASTASDAEALTVAEMKVVLRQLMLALQGMQDDTGREGYNVGALSKVLVMGNQQFEQALKETIAALLIGGGDSNPYFLNIAEPVINPYLGVTNDYLYMAAVGDSSRMPMLYQERTPVQVNVYNSADDIAENDGLKVLCRQRFRFGYGEFRRMVLTLVT